MLDFEVDTGIKGGELIDMACREELVAGARILKRSRR